MCVWFKQDILSLHYFSADTRLGKSEWCRHTPSKAKGSCARKTGARRSPAAWRDSCYLCKGKDMRWWEGGGRSFVYLEVVESDSSLSRFQMIFRS